MGCVLLHLPNSLRSMDSLKVFLRSHSIHLLNNEPLPEDEAILLRTLHTDAVAYLLTPTLECGRLAEERSALESVVIQCNLLFSPMRLVPNEVLTIIFKTALDYPPPHHILTLALVCRRWKQVVGHVSRPERLSIILGNPQPYPTNINNVHRSIAARIVANNDVRALNWPRRLAFPTSKRWVSLKVEGLGSKLFQPLTQDLGLQLPLLRTLRLHINAKTAKRHVGKLRLHAFEHCPSLRDVELECMAQLNAYTMILLPWEQLVRYVERSEGTVAVNYVLNSPYLEELSYYAEGWASIVKCRHEGLKKLNLEASFSVLEHILDNLALPAVQHLQVVSDTNEDYDILAEFIQRSECHLLTLSVHLGALLDPDLTEVLELCPSLHRLDITNISTCDLQALSSRKRGTEPTTTPALPELQELTLRFTPDYLKFCPKIRKFLLSQPQRIFDSCIHLSLFKLILPSSIYRLKLHALLECTKQPPKFEILLGRLADEVFDLTEKYIMKDNHGSESDCEWHAKNWWTVNALNGLLTSMEGHLTASGIALVVSFHFNILRSTLMPVPQISRLYEAVDRLYTAVKTNPQYIENGTTDRVFNLWLNYREVLTRDKPVTKWRADGPVTLRRTRCDVDWGYAEYLEIGIHDEEIGSDGPEALNRGFCDLKRSLVDTQ
jgi:F-box-like